MISSFPSHDTFTLQGLRWLAMGSFLVAFGAGRCAGQTAAPTHTTSAATSPRIVAYVDEMPIFKGQVDRLLRRQGMTGSTHSAVDRQRALSALIDQHLASINLMRRSKGNTSKEIEAAWQRWRERLSDRNQDESEFLIESGLTLDAVRHEIAWQVNWQRYLDRHLTESSLQQYFDRHHREFDGTQLNVRQIQWNLRPENFGEGSVEVDPHTSETLVRQAARLRERIVKRELTFVEAAERFSESPSSVDGGQLGWIQRDGPMHEDFSQAAFALQQGEVSDPVLSPFGVHLILCEEVRPGDLTFEQQREEVRVAATRFLFRRLADQQRAESKVRLVIDSKDGGR